MPGAAGIARALLAGLLLATAAAAVRPRDDGGSTPGQAQAQPDSFAPGQVLVKFKSSGPAVASLLGGTAGGPPGKLPVDGVRLLRTVGGGSKAGAASAAPRPGATVLLRITDGASVKKKVLELMANPAVAVAEPNYIRRTLRVPDDVMYGPRPRYSGMWFLDRIGAPRAWNTTTGSKSVKVCVVDTGAKRSHIDLGGNLAGGWFTGTRGAPTYARDEPGTPGFYNYEDTNVVEEAFHGTHTAGSIGAVGNNGIGVTGVNCQVSLWICNGFTEADVNAGFYSDALVDCYTLCREADAHVVSVSIGGYSYSQLEHDAIEALGKSGALFVAAAGNEANEYQNLYGRLSYPASYQTPSGNVISVAASTINDDLASFSNSGPHVHLAAPGAGIVSTWGRSTNEYVGYSGTSMATPLTAGAAALLWSDATMAQIKLLGQPEPTPPPRAPRPRYSLVVLKGQLYRMNAADRADRFDLPAADCMRRCESEPWCFFAIHYGEYRDAGDGKLINCALLDEGSFTLRPALRDAKFTYGYKVAITGKSPPNPPSPRPSPPSPSGNDDGPACIKAGSDTPSLAFSSAWTVQPGTHYFIAVSDVAIFNPEAPFPDFRWRLQHALPAPTRPPPRSPPPPSPPLPPSPRVGRPKPPFPPKPTKPMRR
ncbi:peptidase S8 [Micractinium conductrix]|uniref:Peptidase S8 n=1 Tax=Micractinium conductrix TaxID=554055 RepID=A0A2P6VCM5_9CHLO|nr:peptidase S8 [Micractinium conductrix]|eukprot:PSC71832.1 peptidase S8 [Micractinium conductrix]